MPEPSDAEQFRTRLGKLNRFFLFAFCFMGIGYLYWGTIRTPFLTQQADNPRTVESELRIQRGLFYDTVDRPLVVNDVAASGVVSRFYFNQTVAPVVGYYSLRFGTAGLEGVLDPSLRGELRPNREVLASELLNRPTQGDDYRLTLDLDLQRFAAREMAGRRGALLLVSADDGAVRALVSMPSYDPNMIDERFEIYSQDDQAPLLNRVTQNIYQPGPILLPFFLADALEDGQTVASLGLDHTVGITDTVELSALWSETLLQMWDIATLEDSLQRYQFVESPRFLLPVITDPDAPSRRYQLQETLEGEGDLLLSPLQVAVAATALGGRGELKDLSLVGGTRGRDPNAEWAAFQYSPEENPRIENLLSPETVVELLKLLPQHENVAELAITVDAGPDIENSWYLGFSPAVTPRYFVVIVLEDEANPDVGSALGRALLGQALE